MIWLFCSAPAYSWSRDRYWRLQAGLRCVSGSSRRNSDSSSRVNRKSPSTINSCCSPSLSSRKVRDPSTSLARTRIRTSLRACASRRSWAAAARAAVPAVVGPGAADQSATDDGGIGQRQPELDNGSTPLGAPAQLAVLVAPGVGALDDPAVAGLDRGWQPAGGDLADHAPLGQNLATRLVVVAGVQVHHGLGGQRPDHLQGV